ncbi:MAG TPA: hypothetical protein VN956_26495 [Pyrinomonadaceae bacterium]|nr:hypothetical protein [Pyrinomonadaceae bacterium]
MSSAGTRDYLFDGPAKILNRNVIYSNFTISIDPGDADTYQLRGLAYFRNKAQLTVALADAEKAISLNDQKGDYYQLRGSILCLQGISQESTSLLNAGLRDLSRAIDLEPNQYKFYEVRASIYRKIGETEKADADDRKADDLKGRRFLQKSP